MMGNLKRKDEGEEGPEYTTRNTFEEELGHFTIEKDLLLKGLKGFIHEQQSELETQFAELHAKLEGDNEPQPNQQGPTFAITTRSGTTTKDPPYPDQSPTTNEPETDGERAPEPTPVPRKTSSPTSSL